ncbi:MAG: glycine cleavage system protein GcvH [Gammaproteobacteria bacterium AqS3]|nr:glycine cleavage system protein GcvH [Gammaproteobacteria bacterium AqS3]
MSDLRFTETHEWALPQEDGSVRVGISHYAQEQLGDVVYTELPQVGSVLQAGAVAGVVESVKAASDIYAPLAGEVSAVNEALEAAPETVNQAAEADGWLFQIRPEDSAALEGLLERAAYEDFLRDS